MRFSQWSKTISKKQTKKVPARWLLQFNVANAVLNSCIATVYAISMMVQAFKDGFVAPVVIASLSLR